MIIKITAKWIFILYFIILGYSIFFNTDLFFVMIALMCVYFHSKKKEN
jgi:hypothetical protein